MVSTRETLVATRRLAYCELLRDLSRAAGEKWAGAAVVRRSARNVSARGAAGALSR
jgi:hypothetical protein